MVPDAKLAQTLKNLFTITVQSLYIDSYLSEILQY